MNTWCKKRKTELYTWNSPGDQKCYQTDYIHGKQRFRNSIRGMKTLPGAYIDLNQNPAAEVQTKLKPMKKAGMRKLKCNLKNQE
jgi:hypothetical protein